MANFYHLDERRRRGIWIFETPDTPDGIRLRLMLSKGLEFPPDTRVPLVLMKRGERQDFTCTVLGLGVASEEIKTIVEREAPGDVQFLVADLPGEPMRLYVMNVLHYPDCLHRSLSDFSGTFGSNDFRLHKAAIAANDVGPHRVFVPKFAGELLVVDSHLADRLREADVSGIELIPLASA